MSNLKAIFTWVGVGSVLAGAMMGCGSGGGGDPTGAGGDGTGGILPGTGGSEGGSGGPPCPDLFDDGPPKTFSVEISDAEWQAMDAEFHNLDALETGQDFT